MNKKELKISAVWGVGYYIGTFLLLRFMDWVSNDWISIQTISWIYWPSILVIGKRYFLYNILLNIVFWTLGFVAWGFLWVKTARWVQRKYFLVG